MLLLPDVPVGDEILSQATDGLLIGIIGGIIGLYLLVKMMIRTQFWQQLTSPGIQKKEDGYTTTFGWETLIGQIGTAESDLHPSGWVIIEDQRVFVVSEGEFLDKGTAVKILSVDGNRVVVRKLNENTKEGV